MKAKILPVIVIIFIFLFFKTASAQIVLDTIFPITSGGSSYQLLRLEKSGYKWLLIDHAVKEMTLLNMDKSIFKQFSYQLDSGYSVHYKYISEVLFDNDSSDLEFMLQYVGPGSLHNYFQIWDEAGNMIFSRDSARIYETYGVGIENILSNGITNTDAGTVMMVLLNEQLSNRRLEIYKLPGYYECSVCAYYHLKLMPLTVPDEELRHVNSVKAFPNPSNDKIAVEYNLPAQNQSGTMAIYDMNGQRIRLYKLSPKSNSITIDIQGLKAGNYLCVVESGGQQVSGRIIKVE